VSDVSLEGPVVFGSATRVGRSLVAVAAAEADHYTAAAREFVDSSVRSDCIRREWECRGRCHRDWTTVACESSGVVLLEGVVPAAGDSRESLSIQMAESG
jgi:hypothetical protein